MSTSEFLTKMQSIVDELASAGCPVTAREHVSFILVGLGPRYDALVAALGVVTTPISSFQLCMPSFMPMSNAKNYMSPPALILTPRLTWPKDSVAEGTRASNMVIVLIVTNVGMTGATTVAVISSLAQVAVVGVLLQEGGADMGEVAVAPHHG
jgi:hypothetical protein